MAFSLFRTKYIPVCTLFNANLAWIVQDYLLAHRIGAIIEVEPCMHGELCKGVASYSVCVPGRKAMQAKKLAERCMVVNGVDADA